MAIHLTTFSPRCCCRSVSTLTCSGYVPQGIAYRDLEHELLAIVVGLKGVENGGELLGVELDCRMGQLGC